MAALVRPGSAAFSVGTNDSIQLLIAGDIGALRAKLVAGRSLTLWTTETVSEAIELGSEESPRMCLTRYHLDGGTALDVIEGLRTRGSDVPVVVLLHPDEWDEAQACLQAGAIDVIESSDVDQILYVTTRYLGLAFGRAPRTLYESQVSVEVDGRWHHLDTTDLRATGVAVRDLPSTELGERVRVRLELMERTLEIWAFVARRWDREGEAMAGLHFAAIAREDRTWLESTVCALRAVNVPSKPAPRPSIEVDPTAELQEPEDDDHDPLEQPRWHLSQVLSGEGDRDEHPRWVYGVVPELTPIERAGATGVVVPEWVRQALGVRLLLARYRDDCPVGTPPKPITEACQTLMDELSREHEEAQDFDVAEQISLIKGRIIREFLDGGGAAPLADFDQDDFGFQPLQDIVAPSPLTLPQPQSPTLAPPTAARIAAAGPVRRASPRRAPTNYGDPFIRSAQRLSVALGCTLAVLIVIALCVRVLSRDDDDRTLAVVGAKELSSPMLVELEVSADFASGTISNAWFTMSPEQRSESFAKLKKRMTAWELPVRYIVLHSESKEPVAMFNFDDGTLISLEQPAHLLLSRSAL